MSDLMNEIRAELRKLAELSADIEAESDLGFSGQDICRALAMHAAITNPLAGDSDVFQQAETYAVLIASFVTSGRRTPSSQLHAEGAAEFRSGPASISPSPL